MSDRPPADPPTSDSPDITEADSKGGDGAEPAGADGGDTAGDVDAPVALLVAAFLMSAGANAYSISPASVTPLITAQYGVDKTVVGLSISVFILGLVLSQLPSGVVMDRLENRALAMGATVVLVVAAVVGVVVQSLAGLLVPRFIAGLAFPFLFIMLTKLVAAAFPEACRGTATSVFTASAPSGIALGQLATPPLAAWLGLSSAFIVYPLMTLLAAIPFYAFAPAHTTAEGNVLSLSAVRDVVTSPPLVLMSLSSTCGYAVYFFLNAWIPTYAAEELAFPLAEAGAVAALVPVTGIVARPSGGWLSDRLGGRRRPVVVLSLAVTVPAVLAIVVVPMAWLFAALLLFVGFAVQFPMGVYYVMATEITPDGAAGTGLAVFGTISFTGTLLSPVVGGWLVETFSWPVTFGVFGAVGVLGILFVLPVTRDREVSITGAD